MSANLEKSAVATEWEKAIFTPIPKKDSTKEVTGKFGFQIQNEAEQRLTEFCQGNTLVTANISSNNKRNDSAHGHQQIVSTLVRPVIFLASEDGEALYNQKTRIGADCGSDPKKAMAPHSSTLAWKIPWTEEPGRLQSMGSLRIGHD